MQKETEMADASKDNFWNDSTQTVVQAPGSSADRSHTESKVAATAGDASEIESIHSHTSIRLKAADLTVDHAGEATTTRSASDSRWTCFFSCFSCCSASGEDNGRDFELPSPLSKPQFIR